ncbi:MAG: TonB family protein [Bacteroidota bacterium]
MHEEVAVYQNKTRMGRLRLVAFLFLCAGGIFVGKSFLGMGSAEIKSVTLGQGSFEEIETLLEEKPHALMVVNTRGHVLDTIFSLREYRKLFFEGGVAESGKNGKPSLEFQEVLEELDPIVQLGTIPSATNLQKKEVEKVPQSKNPLLTSTQVVTPSEVDDSKPVVALQPSRSISKETEEDLTKKVAEPPTSSSTAHNLTKSSITALPEFPGGMNALSQYISTHTRYPAQAKADSVSGVVYVSFLISLQGKVKSPKIIRGLGSGCDEEVLRLLSSMPPWNPAKYKGESIEMSYTLSIPFKPSNK